MTETRDSAIQFLYDRVNYERFASMPYGDRHLKLGRMRRLLRLLGSPERETPVVHIAGTKGKGSTAAILTSILHAAGYTVGGYASPHLERIEERISTNGQPCGTARFVELVRHVRPAVEKMERETPDDGPTFFEIMTAMAWRHFICEQADIGVLEVGMGGRLDSTNVCCPLVTAITSIDLDHTEQLGTTLAEIAAEKAGVTKSGIPMVSGVVAAEPAEVIAEKCREMEAPLIRVGSDFVTRGADTPLDAGIAWPTFDFEWTPGGVRRRLLEGLQLGVLGGHQVANAGVALAIVESLREQGWTVPEQAIREGLRSVRCPARVEVVSERPTVIIDGAHNPASASALMETLDDVFPVQQGGKRYLILAATMDKNVEEMVRSLAPRFDRIVATRYTTSPRACSIEQLACLVRAATGADCRTCDDPREAFDLCISEASSDDLICVTGSMYLAGELRSHALAD